MESDSRVALHACSNGGKVALANPLVRRPDGYILSYGVSYRKKLSACPRSAADIHSEFVSKCGFSSAFQPRLDAAVTKRGMEDDLRDVATRIKPHDVVVVFFSGHGMRQGNTACVMDSAEASVSVRKLQAVFAEILVQRRSMSKVPIMTSLVIILDCCQTLSGRYLALWAGVHFSNCVMIFKRCREE